LIADGVLPSNEGRGYVLRKIIRRAVRHAHKLGVRNPIFFNLVPKLVDLMGGHYGELKENEDKIMGALEAEEVRFRQTLDKGLNLLETELENQKDSKIFNGTTAFTLHDTYGFPLDLTQSILRDRGISVDTTAFDAAMAEQKKRAKESWVGSGDVKNEKVYFELKKRLAPTEFVGYDEISATGEILALVKNGEEVQEVQEGDEFEFFVNKTPFYGEGGGQVGDTGLALQIGKDGVIPLPFSTIEIIDVKKVLTDYYAHKGILRSGKIKVGDHINLSINNERRARITANHSALHLLEAALRKLYGDSVVQKGSHVNEFRGRYDFALGKAVPRADIIALEEMVNAVIYQKGAVRAEIMPLEEAKKTGAIALFNEKYGEKVRVVFMGEETSTPKTQGSQATPKSPEALTEALHVLNNTGAKTYFSVDFCGGTHVKNTGAIGIFKIASEGSVGAGIRRIEVFTGLEAIKYLNEIQNIAIASAEVLKVGLKGLPERATVTKSFLVLVYGYLFLFGCRWRAGELSLSGTRLRG
jgi:alanyl-tRNA synthetase